MATVYGAGVAEADAVGSIKPFGGSTPPPGWVSCDGSAISRTTYSDLFAILGTTYGVGDGSTTFNVPDLRGRSPVGAGTGPSLSARGRGNTGGEEAHTLSNPEMRSHNHGITDTYFIERGGTSGTRFGTTTSNWQFYSRSITASQGGSGSHNTMHPFGVVKYVIRT